MWVNTGNYKTIKGALNNAKYILEKNKPTKIEKKNGKYYVYVKK